MLELMKQFEEAYLTSKESQHFKSISDLYYYMKKRIFFNNQKIYKTMSISKNLGVILTIL